MPALPSDRLRPDVTADQPPRYGDDSWLLSLLHHGVGARTMRIIWSTFPEPFREIARATAWTMLNHGLDQDLVERRAVGLQQHPSPGTAELVLLHWRRFFRWLRETRPLIQRLGEVSEEDLEAWALHLRQTRASRVARLHGLIAVSYLHGHGWLLDPVDRIMRPPWLGGGFHRYIGEYAATGENSTPPIATNTISALLTASLAVIDEFLAQPASQRRHPDRATIVRTGGACLVVLAYLTGMRPQEVLSLRRTCYKEVPAANGGTRHEIRGLTFKGERDEQGRQLTEGRVRKQPWATIEPAGRAVAAAKILAKAVDPDGDLLFPRLVVRSTAARMGRGITPPVANLRIDRLIEYVNEVVVERGWQPIPEDPDGRITLSRFRRTLAWHIVRQPLGEVALGVQYGHVRIITGQGYAGRAEAGLQGLIEIEEVASVVDLLDELAEGRRNGETASGPAAERLTSTISRFESQFAGSKMTDKGLRRLRATPDMKVFDNPRAMSVCVFNPSTAACHQPGAATSAERATPTFDLCQKTCRNHARTDRHIDALKVEREGLEAEAAQAPEPIAVRLGDRIADIDRIVAGHEAASRSASIRMSANPVERTGRPAAPAATNHLGRRPA